MILVDANVLVALVDPEDALRARAVKDLSAMGRSRLLLAEPALAEAVYLTPDEHIRRRIPPLIEALNIQPISEPPERIWPAIFEWLERYSEHSPDWTDAYLIALCGMNRQMRVWSYDREFRTIWRRMDGSKIPLAIAGI